MEFFVEVPSKSPFLKPVPCVNTPSFGGGGLPDTILVGNVRVLIG